MDLIGDIIVLPLRISRQHAHMFLVTDTDCSQLIIQWSSQNDMFHIWWF